MPNFEIPKYHTTCFAKVTFNDATRSSTCCVIKVNSKGSELTMVYE